MAMFLCIWHLDGLGLFIFFHSCFLFELNLVQLDDVKIALLVRLCRYIYAYHMYVNSIWLYSCNIAIKARVCPLRGSMKIHVRRCRLSCGFQLDPFFIRLIIYFFFFSFFLSFFPFYLLIDICVFWHGDRFA